MDLYQERINAVDVQLKQYPSALAQEFNRTLEMLIQSNNSPDLKFGKNEQVIWAELVIEISKQAVRSWEAAAEFMKASPKVFPFLSFNDIIKWAETGKLICSKTPTLAAAYFRSSPGSLPYLSPSQIEDWGKLGLSLYKGSWRSSAIATRFFEISPELLKTLSIPQLQRFIEFILIICEDSYDLANDCLTISSNVFSTLGDSRDYFIELIIKSSLRSTRDIKAIFENTNNYLPLIAKKQQLRLLQIALTLSDNNEFSVSGFIESSARSISKINAEHHSTLLDLSETAINVAPSSVSAFLNSAPIVLNRIEATQLREWFDEGIKLLSDNFDSGMAFFRLESNTSESVIENLSSAIEFPRIKEIIHLYCRALAGAEMTVESSERIAEKGIGWVSKERPTTEGTTVFLPPQTQHFSTKAENFEWLKVITTHQIGHLEFGSFEFQYDKPSTLLENMRPEMNSKNPSTLLQDGDMPTITSMQKFFDLFPERQLALDIFKTLEDGRVAKHISREYRGIVSAYNKAQREALKDRPNIETLPAREAIVEFLVRLSLYEKSNIKVPLEYIDSAKLIGGIANLIFAQFASVEDTAEATIRIYSILNQIINEEIPDEDWTDLDPDNVIDYQEPDDLDKVFPGSNSSEQSEDIFDATQDSEGTYASPQEVDFRGDFKPETVQLLSQLKMVQDKANQGDATPLTKEMLEQLLKENVEIETSEGEAKDNTSAFANNMMQEAGTPPPASDSQLPGTNIDAEDDGDSLESNEPETHLYDEWDFRADDYRPRWCIVRERVIAEGTEDFWHQTMEQNAMLVSEIRRQFELTAPQSFRKIRHLRDGEDFDFDSVIEAMIDRRLGINPTDHIYSRRNKTERDVAVLFLLDMSASTAEAIDEAKRMADQWDAPDDPADYLIWLRQRRSEPVARKSYKRIIDLEKESVILLTMALETLGDSYGFYGFSGYGRENVEFYTIKDLNESLNDRVRKRVDKIAPLHATRMGPAIRHSITKLETIEAKTKLLFLISDGRPQDRGYSREGVEKEYAVHDTRMALLEAKKKGINPFCLTVDKSGHDYLKTMMGDMGYEVLHEISELPRRLPYLYQKLTV